MNQLPQSNSRVSAMRESILAFLPLLAIGLLFLSNIPLWEFFAIFYGMLDLFIFVFLVFFFTYCLVESKLRSKRTSEAARYPWYSLIVAVLLCTFFYAGKLATPFVMQVPNWCQAGQSVRGETAKDGWFVLVLEGRGNKQHFQFTDGYLNCGLGEDRGGISDIDFHPLRFGWWEGYNHIFVDASSLELRRRLEKLKYSESDLETMSIEIWAILEQADRGDPLSSQEYVVEPIWEKPNKGAHHILGCLIWLAASFLALLLLGQLEQTLTKAKPS